MVPFGGWEMPLSYPNGTIAEHLACRQAAVAFDVSHLGTVRISGAQAQRSAAVDPDQRPGQDRRRAGPSTPICSTTPTGRCSTTSSCGGSTTSASTSCPTLPTRPGSARPWVARTSPPNGPSWPSRDRPPGSAWRWCPEAAAGVGRFRVIRFSWGGQTCVAAGTGYTGEDGVECAVPAAVAPSFWEAVLATGVQPAGLGARDTLRLEAALPLHGHELGPGITPLQAGLGWVVSWSKPEGFRGRAALNREKEAGVSRLLAGLATEGRQPPRTGAPVLAGRPVGRRGHQRQLLPGARPRHRPGLPPAGPGRRHSPSSWTCGVAGCRPGWSPCRS